MNFKTCRWTILLGTLLAFGLGDTGLVAPAAAQSKPPAKPPKLKMSFVKLKAGQFSMGCSKDDNICADDEKPAHIVRITKAFEIGRYEVSQDDWVSVMRANPSNFATSDGWAERPVEQVSWNDVQEYLQKLNDRHDGYHYRLPTEAEWEYAARGGENVSIEPGGMSWNGGNSGGQTHQIGTKMPNSWGLYDVRGNVWEWVQDWYSANYYGNSPAEDPPGPAEGNRRVYRGGSWGSSQRETRISARAAGPPDSKNQNIGFRIVRETAAP